MIAQMMQQDRWNSNNRQRDSRDKQEDHWNSNHFQCDGHDQQDERWDSNDHQRDNRGDRGCGLGGDRHARGGHDREVDRGAYDRNV